MGSDSILLVDGVVRVDDAMTSLRDDCWEVHASTAVLGHGLLDGQALAGAVIVTHFVSQLALDVGRALVFEAEGGGKASVTDDTKSVVATADQLHLVPAADAEDANAVQVDGVGAPDESGMQH